MNATFFFRVRGRDAFIDRISLGGSSVESLSRSTALAVLVYIIFAIWAGLPALVSASCCRAW